MSLETCHWVGPFVLLGSGTPRNRNLPPCIQMRFRVSAKSQSSSNWTWNDSRLVKGTSEREEDGPRARRTIVGGERAGLEGVTSSLQVGEEGERPYLLSNLVLLPESFIIFKHGELGRNNEHVVLIIPLAKISLSGQTLN